MLAQTVERVAELVPAENLIIITNAEQRDIILEDLPQLAPEQVIGEPVGRDTAAAVGLVLDSLDDIHCLLEAKNKDPDFLYSVLCDLQVRNGN